jgi:transglutaminase-like putative cysteine protease
MLLKLTHTTDLIYSDPISESIMELRMAPRQEMDQHRLSFNLGIGPTTQVSSYFDWLGNTVHSFALNAFHQRIRIIATSVVETDRKKLNPETCSDCWPLPPQTSHMLYDYQQFGGPVIDCPQLHEMVKRLRAEPGIPLGVLGLRMLRLIGEECTYHKGVTTAASPITDILDHRCGVCQDFAHLMIGLARALKIPARYVSGLVHPDSESFRGYTQTHAWVELLFPSVGWIGFDPTNQSVVSDNFVKVAVGRDFRDVAPNRGVYRGKAREEIDVAVQSIVLTAVPQGMAAERITSLALAVSSAVATPPMRFNANQQQEQQAQQQQQQQQQS